MIRFFVYNNLKSYLQGGDPSKDIGTIKTFIIGGIAGAASVFGNTPVDVVKTRMQAGCNSITCGIGAGEVEYLPHMTIIIFFFFKKKPAIVTKFILG